MKAKETEKKKFGIGLLSGNLLWLVICRCIWQFTTNIPRPYLPLYIEILGGSPADIGVVNFASAIAGLFLYPLGGYIADKEGRVRLVAITTFLYAFSFIPFAYAPNWQTLAVASFFQNLVLFYAPILTVLQADSIPAGMRTQGFAIAVSIPGALGIVSPLLGGWLVDYMGIADAMHLTYMIGFGAGILVAFLRMYKLEETLDPAMAEKIDYRHIWRLLKESYQSFIETLKWMPNEIKVLAVMQMMQFFFNGLAGAFYIVYATSLVGISATSWGMTSAIQGGIRLLIATPAGRLMDKIGRRRLLIPFMALTPFYPLVFLIVQNFTQLALLVVVMAIGNAFLMPGFQSLLADNTPRERRGRVTSAVGGGNFFIDVRGTGMGGGMLLFVPMALSQLLGGIFYEINPTLPFKVMAVGMALTTIWAYLKVKDPKELYV